MGGFHLLTNFGATCLKRGEESSKFPYCNFLPYFFLTLFLNNSLIFYVGTESKNKI